MFLLLSIITMIWYASANLGWTWLWYVFGAILVVGGVYALFNPVGTFLAVAQVLGFVLVLVGIFWMVEAFATRIVKAFMIREAGALVAS